MLEPDTLVNDGVKARSSIINIGREYMGKWENSLVDGVAALSRVVIALRTTQEDDVRGCLIGRARCIGVLVRPQAREGTNKIK